MTAALLVAILALPAAADVRLPLDEAGSLLELTPALEARLGLFPGVTAFSEARLYRQDDGSCVLEWLRAEGGVTIRERRALDAAACEAFRRDVAARLKERAPAALLDQRGRAGLLVAMVLPSLVYYGPGTIAVVGSDNESVMTGSFLVAAALGLAVPYVRTRALPVTPAQATLTTYHLLAGGWHGLWLTQAAAGLKPSGDRGGRAYDRVQGAAMMGGSMLEGWLAFRRAGRARMEEGPAMFLEATELYGYLLGLAASDLAGWEREVPNNSSTRGGASLRLAGAAGGLTAGIWLNRRERYSQGDTAIVFLATALGGYLPLAAVDAFHPDHRAYTAAATAGSLAGVWTGTHLVRRKDFAAGDGGLTAIATLAGGLGGLGISYLATGGLTERERSPILLASSGIGALGGFWFGLRSRGAGGDEGWRLTPDPRGVLPSAPGLPPAPLLRLEHAL